MQARRLSLISTGWQLSLYKNHYDRQSMKCLCWLIWWKNMHLFTSYYIQLQMNCTVITLILSKNQSGTNKTKRNRLIHAQINLHPLQSWWATKNTIPSFHLQPNLSTQRYVRWGATQSGLFTEQLYGRIACLYFRCGEDCSDTEEYIDTTLKLHFSLYVLWKSYQGFKCCSWYVRSPSGAISWICNSSK